jgi:regulatory associated protein of mTOR
MAPPKALENIGKTLHSQYERWQPKVRNLISCLCGTFMIIFLHLHVLLAWHLQARYKLQLDPTVEEVKKLCNTCRKYARSERILFHYNGHGVPKPTANGEIWVFNKVNVTTVLHVLIVDVFTNQPFFPFLFAELHPVYSASYH